MFSKEKLFDSKQAYVLLKERENQLEQLVQEKEKAIKTKPDGRLHVVKRGSRPPQFYLRTAPCDKSGKYIKKDNNALAAQLAQSEYDEKVIQTAETELKWIRKLLEHVPENNFLKIFENIGSIRQRMISPVEESIEEFAENWQKREYDHAVFHEESLMFLTRRKERVRSKSEVIIANMLDDFHVPYHYEYPFCRDGFVYARPDFLVLNRRTRKEYYWEHFGMMDDSAYLKSALNKIDNYQRFGLFYGERILYTFESSANVLNTETVEELIKKYLL